MNPFFAHLKELYEKRKGSSLDRAQGLGWDRFCALGLPTTPLRDLYSKHFSFEEAISTSWVPQDNTLVFVNGEYVDHLSRKPKEITILPLKEAAKTFAAFLQGRWNAFREEKDSFAALNAALCQEGVFLYVPSGCHLSHPLKIVHKVFTKHPLPLFTPRLHLYAGKESSLSLIVESEEGVPSWTNGVMDFLLDEKAFVSLVLHIKQHEEAWHMEAIRASLKKESRFHSLTVTNGGKMVRNDFHLALNDEGAHATVEGAWLLDKKREIAFNVVMEHNAPHTFSHQKFKGVLAEHSRSSFEGKIRVKKNALKTEAYQVNHNLLLSDKAFATSKPNLEIFADDVKASHGATVGQLDEESLFYLKSRGIATQDAQRILIQGFLQDVHPEVLKWLT